MKLKPAVLSLTIAVILTTDLSSNISYQKQHEFSAPTHKLEVDMRKLWEDHVIWTRNAILCVVDDLPGTEQAVKRLMKNQMDIGNAIKPYYGNAAGDKLTRLLCEIILISKEAVKYAKDANIAALYETNKNGFQFRSTTHFF